MFLAVPLTAGVGLWVVSGSVVLRGSSVTGNGLGGVLVEPGAELRVEGCTLDRNGGGANATR